MKKNQRMRLTKEVPLLLLAALAAACSVAGARVHHGGSEIRRRHRTEQLHHLQGLGCLWLQGGAEREKMCCRVEK